MDRQQDPAAQDGEALTMDEYVEFMREIEEQPTWKANADREMDYADGNQLDGALLQKMRDIGVPPAIEDAIGPALLAIEGYERTTRTDWKVSPNGGSAAQDVADAINFKLNEAERESRADQACSDAFRPQMAVGLGWAEVTKNSDPFAYPYRCVAVHRNEIDFDFKSRESDLSDARYLRRKRWLRAERIASVFPQHKDLIEACGRSGSMWWQDAAMAAADGGQSTGLTNAWGDPRAMTMQESFWYNPSSKELLLSEVWYRRWVSALVMKTRDGRVVEYDAANELHAAALATGVATVQRAVIARVRRSYWLGPHLLFDEKSPYTHKYFPYVPFWGFREDNTAVPYGYVRGMIYAQDSLNSGNSKLRHGMSVVRVERTKGAVDMTDAQLRRQIARPDADVVLDAEHMARPGARFEVKRDYTLTDQHYRMLENNRMTIERVSTITSGFMGRQGTANSGYQEQQQIEQSNQALAKMMGNFRDARRLMGEMLMSMIIADIGESETGVLIEGNALAEDRHVVLNEKTTDPATGLPMVSNDLLRTRLKVALTDVPSTSSYKGQQLNAMSEAVKSLPPQYQAAALPFMASLMDVPFQREFVQAIRDAGQQATPEQVQEQIKQAVADALAKAGNDLKARELDMKERLTDAQIKQIVGKAVQDGVQAAYSAMQAGAQVAQMPQIAPIADAIMASAGYQAPNPGGDDPNYPIVAQAMNTPQGIAPQANTSPAFPAVPQHAGTGMQGIETPRITDGAQEEMSEPVDNAQEERAENFNTNNNPGVAE